jgi:hypothetical protein
VMLDGCTIDGTAGEPDRAMSRNLGDPLTETRIEDNGNCDSRLVHGKPPNVLPLSRGNRTRKSTALGAPRGAVAVGFSGRVGRRSRIPREKSTRLSRVSEYLAGFTDHVRR